MLIINILVILLLLYLMITNFHLIYHSNNIEYHMNTNSLYAHFSKIDNYNYIIFPKLALTHPQHYILKTGQSMYIPKKWWHWIKTTKKTFAINYWFNNNIKIDEPYIIDKSYINYDINLLNNEMVYVWNSKTGNNYKIKFNKFYNSGLDYKYIITLNDYYSGNNNMNIKEKLEQYITFPSDTSINIGNPVANDNYGYNIWISSGKHDTGLHYDDEDGILTILEGEKEIIMFPPSDSKYLYPFEVSYMWLNNNAYNFKYNSYYNSGKITGISSNELLYETSKHDLRVLSNISKLYCKFKQDTLIWGFKKNKDIYRWEFYHYTLNNRIRITSWDLHSSKYNIPEIEHHYYKSDDKNMIGLPFWGYGKYKENNILYDESKIFVIDTYDSFSYNYNDYMNRLEYNGIKEKFKNIILNKYKCYELCIHNKNPNQIFVQYLGISNKDFLEFLITNDYPKNIIDYIKTNISLGKYNINNEITIVYNMETLEIIRSGFYGYL